MRTREELLKNGHSLDADSMIYGERLVKAILAAPTEKQMKCQYCAGMNLEDYHQLLEENRLDDSSYIDRVKYCEVCGRRLGDE